MLNANAEQTKTGSDLIACRLRAWELEIHEQSSKVINYRDQSQSVTKSSAIITQFVHIKTSVDADKKLLQRQMNEKRSPKVGNVLRPGTVTL